MANSTNSEMAGQAWHGPSFLQAAAEQEILTLLEQHDQELASTKMALELERLEKELAHKREAEERAQKEYYRKAFEALQKKMGGDGPDV